MSSFPKATRLRAKCPREDALIAARLDDEPTVPYCLELDGEGTAGEAGCRNSALEGVPALLDTLGRHLRQHETFRADRNSDLHADFAPRNRRRYQGRAIGIENCPVFCDGRDTCPQEIDPADEVRDEGVGWPIVDIARSTELDNAPVIHYGNAVCHRHRFGLIVGNEDRRNAESSLNLYELDLHGFPQLKVQCPEGLVH